MPIFVMANWIAKLQINVACNDIFCDLYSATELI